MLYIHNTIPMKPLPSKFKNDVTEISRGHLMTEREQIIEHHFVFNNIWFF